MSKFKVIENPMYKNIENKLTFGVPLTTEEKQFIFCKNIEDEMTEFRSALIVWLLKEKYKGQKIVDYGAFAMLSDEELVNVANTYYENKK